MLQTLLRLTTRQLDKRGAHTSSFSHLKLTKTTEHNGIREIMLNDPKTRNSLSIAMINDLLQDLTTGWDDSRLRCIILSSCGPTIFSAGHNLKELVPEKGKDSHLKVFLKFNELISSISRAPVPVIAKVDGLAAAAGLQMAASCDMLVCSENSTFSTPGVNFGIFCSTPGIAISRKMPRMKSAYMLFTGLPITAQDAYISGLVTSVVPSNKLDHEVDRICSAISAKSREVVKLGKEFYYKQLEMGISEAYQCGANIMAENLSLNDGMEGIKSFVEKRKPNWQS